MAVLDEAPKIYVYSFTTIARISSSVIVKYGSRVFPCEARNMHFVAGLKHLRVPKVFDTWDTQEVKSDEETVTTTYIMMEYIHGKRVYDVWTILTPDGRRNIHQQIFEMIQELQKHKLPDPGPLGGGISNGAYFTDYGAGPFGSVVEMEDWFNERLEVCKDFGRALPQHLSFTGKFQKLVMCHFDLHTQNIILDREGNVWLIYWAFAGAYPPYFEVAALSRTVDPSFASGLLELMEIKRDSEEICQLNSIGFAITTGAFCKPRNT